MEGDYKNNFEGNPKEIYISLAEATIDTPYSQEYLSLLARKRKLPARKIGRNWFTTKDAIAKYIADQQKALVQELEKKNNGLKGNQVYPVKPQIPAFQLPTALVSDISTKPFSVKSEVPTKQYVNLLGSLSSAGIDFSEEFGNLKFPPRPLLQKSVFKFTRRFAENIVITAMLAAIFFTAGVLAKNLTYQLNQQITGSVFPEAATRQNFTALAYRQLKDLFRNTLTSSTRDLNNAAAVAEEKIGVFDPLLERVSLLLNSFRDTSGQVVEAVKGALIGSYSTVKIPALLPSQKVVETLPPSPPQQIQPPQSSSTPKIIPPINPSIISHVQELTKVTQVTEKREVFVPADLAVVKKDILSNVDALNKAIRDQFEGELISIRSSLSQTSSQAASSYQMVTLTQRVDQLSNPSIYDGLDLKSGTLSIDGGSLFIASGGSITADSLSLRKGFTSSSGTSTITNLSVTGNTSLGNTQTGTLSFNAGTLAFNNSATTTIPDSTINAYTIATSTTGIPFLTFDTKNSRIGVGTTSPASTFSVAGDIYSTGNITFVNGQLLTIYPTPGTHSFPSWSIGAARANATSSSLVINPATIPSVDSNLFGIAVGGSAKFLVDSEGDVYANTLTTAGSVTAGSSTASNFMIENSTYIGDAITDLFSINSGNIVYNNRATSTIVNNAVNAWSIATSSTIVPTFSISTAASPFGMIGIGTTSPATTLAVSGNIYNTGGLGIGIATSTTGAFQTTGPAQIGTDLNVGSLLSINGTTGTSTFAQGQGFNFGNGQFVVQQTSGNVGIGTVSPGNLFTAGSYNTGVGGFALYNGGYGTIAAGQNGIGSGGALSITGWDSITMDARDETFPIRIRGKLISYSNTNLRIQSQSGYNLLLNADSGNVGIGTTSPGALLSVAASGSASGGINPGNLLFAGVNTIYASSSTTTIPTAVNAYSFATSNTATPIISFDGTNSRVGIGTAGPRSLIEINTAVTSKQGLIAMASLSALANQTAYAHILGSDTDGTRTKGTLIWHRESSDTRPSLEVAYGTGPTIMATFVNGKVGIGTTSPGQLLSVAGDILGNNHIGSYFTGTSTTATSTLSTGGLNIGSGQFVVQQTSGNVGIGTASPSAALEVNKSGTGGTTDFVRFFIPNLADNTGAYIRFGREEAVIGKAGTLNYILGTAAQSYGDSSIVMDHYGDSNDFVIKKGGNIGLGIQVPVNRLDVNGAMAVGAFAGTAAPSSGLIVSGNVGIGTTSPGALLSVAASGSASGGINPGNLLFAGVNTIYASSSTTTIPTAVNAYSFATSNTATPIISFDGTNSRVGIGTANPSQVLSVQKNQNASSLIEITNTDVTNADSRAVIKVTNGGSTYIQEIGAQATGYLSTTENTLSLNSNETERAILNSNGLSIRPTTDSTSVSTGALIVPGGAGIAKSLFVGTLLSVNGTTGTSTFALGQGLTFGTSQFVVQQTSGNVGIGTTNPSRALHVFGTSAAEQVYITGSNSLGTSIALYDSSNATRRGWLGIDPSGGALVSGGTAEGLLLNSNADLFLISGDIITRGIVVKATSGNVGIGTTTPNWLLDVAGTRPSFALSDSSAGQNLKHWLLSSMGGNMYIGTSSDLYATSTPPVLTMTNAGNVGIGTAGPQSKLHVVGTQASFTNVGTQDAGIFLIPSAVSAADAGGRIFFKEDNSNNYGFSMGYNGGADNEILNWPANSFNISRHNNDGTGAIMLNMNRITGNVGIGTTSPWGLLSINPNNITGPAFTVGSTTGTSFIVTNGGSVGIGTASPGVISGTNERTLTISIANLVGGQTASLELVGNRTGDAEVGLIEFLNGASANARLATFGGFRDGADNSGAFRFYTNNAGAGTVERMRIDHLGNVGIGTTSPGQLLSVAGDILGNNLIGSYFTGTSTTATSTLSTGGLNIGSGQFVVQQTSGNVGIGTTEPRAKLDVTTTGGGSGSTAIWTPLIIEDSTQSSDETTAGYGVALDFYGRNNAGNRMQFGRIATVNDITNGGGGGNASAALAFYTMKTGSLTGEKMRIDANGNVGIGTASPNGTLDITPGSSSISDGVLLVRTDNTYGRGISIHTNDYVQHTGSTLAIGMGSATGNTYSYLQGYTGGKDTANGNIVINPSGGNVGIGTGAAAPQRQMELSLSGASQTPNLRLSNTEGHGYQSGIEWWNTYYNDGSGGAISGQLMADDATFYAKTRNGASGLLEVFSWNASGIAVGSSEPTKKGDGTIDVSGDIYRNGTAYTNPDYVLEKWATGQIVKFASNEGASTYTGLKSLSEVKNFVSSNYELPLMASSTGGVFGKGDMFLASLEEAYLYLFNHESRINNITEVVNLTSAPTSTPSLVIDSFGNIGIGTSTPQYKLHVEGDIAATSFVNISTQTEKKDISYLSDSDTQNILNKIKTLKVAQYRYNIEPDNAPLRMGLIAEESPPEILANTGKGVDIYKLTTFLLAGIQAQQKQIGQLESQLSTNIQGGQVAQGTNAWSVDQQSGKVNVAFFGNINMQGNNILDVGRIAGMFGKWSIDTDGTLIAVKIVTNEIVTATLAVSNSFVLGTQAKPVGITIYDDATGSPFCIKMHNGAMVSESGECTANPSLNAQTSDNLNGTAATTSTAGSLNIQTSDSVSTTSASTTTSAVIPAPITQPAASSTTATSTVAIAP